MSSLHSGFDVDITIFEVCLLPCESHIVASVCFCHCVADECVGGDALCVSVTVVMSRYRLITLVKQWAMTVS